LRIYKTVAKELYFHHYYELIEEQIGRVPIEQKIVKVNHVSEKYYEIQISAVIYDDNIIK